MKLQKLALFCLALSVLSITSLQAAPASCPSIFKNGKAPETSVSVQVLCNEGYAVGFSIDKKEPLWSAEHLTHASVMEAQNLKGRAQFHEDMRIASSDQATLSDYRNSGWTRGHMTPSGDMPTKSARMETFSLTNIVPQSARLNSGAWEHLEQKTRTEAKKHGDVFVLTGPAFEKENGTIGEDKIAIPTSIWKVVSVPAIHKTEITICTNNDEAACKNISADELTKLTGLKIGE